MTLTIELDLKRIELNHRANYPGQRSFHSKSYCFDTDADTHTLVRLLYLDQQTGRQSQCILYSTFRICRALMSGDKTIRQG